MNNQTTTVPQDVKHLYAVQMRYYDIGKITEYIVIKETPKTYVVTDGRSPVILRGEHIVKKSDMEIYGKYFCESYAAALAYKKELLEKRIADNEHNITEAHKANERYRSMIEATAAELQALEGGNL